jgi:oligopeptide transport system ATP-binding protein
MSAEHVTGHSSLVTNPLLRVQNLRTYFHTRAGVVRAVDDVSFSINAGETLGIVGESGSGKSVACLSLLRLIPSPPGRIESGRAVFEDLARPASGGQLLQQQTSTDGADTHKSSWATQPVETTGYPPGAERVDLLHCEDRQLQKIRGHHISMIFQDPMTSLNPYLRIGDQVIEPLLLHQDVSHGQAWQLGIEALGEVGIPDAEKRMRSHPHELSGGMRQRVMIAMALIAGPRLLIADEPTTALDVTVQAQILDLIRDLQRELGTAVILITHDIGIISGFCDRVLIMYAGRIVESGSTAEIFYEPKHPYNQALQRSIPALHEKGEKLYTIPGAPPDLAKPLPGCPFAPRCEYAREKCVTSEISLKEVAPGHSSACLRVQLGEIELAQSKK